MSRIVEQNLVTVDPGVVEAARSMGTGPWRILFDVVVREALGPLILGYTYVLIAIVDMTAIAGAIGGGGLGQFAITYGYQKFDWSVTLVAVVTIIILVQFAQFLGNWLAGHRHHPPAPLPLWQYFDRTQSSPTDPHPDAPFFSAGQDIPVRSLLVQFCATEEIPLLTVATKLLS